MNERSSSVSFAVFHVQVRTHVNQTKFIVLMLAEDENVFRNFGCAMVIGKVSLVNEHFEY
jgi:hypothetical protein